MTLEKDKRADVNLQCDKMTTQQHNNNRYTHMYLLINQ